MTPNEENVGNIQTEINIYYDEDYNDDYDDKDPLPAEIGF